jgi:hypothetical protein
MASSGADSGVEDAGAAAAAAAALTAALGAARRLEAQLSSVLVRVKRKRAELGEAPGVLLVPHKAPRASAHETLAGALARLVVSGDGAAGAPRQEQQVPKRRALLVCKLVRDEGEEEAGAEEGSSALGGKRRLEDAGGDALDRSLKRRVVELEVSAQGTYSQRATGPAQHDEQADFAIWHAVQTGQTQPLRALVETGMLADVNYARRADGVTALMAACSYLDLELISELLERGADVSLEDHAGFDARARIGFSLDDPARDRVLAAVQLLDGADFVYDHYRVKERVEVSAGGADGAGAAAASAAAAVPGEVWARKGAPTAWQDAPLADFELDLDFLGDELVLDAVDGDDEVPDSDRENENDENYLYNDYPDETSNDAEESSDDSDAYAEDKSSVEDEEEGAVARAARRAARPRGLRRVQMATARDDEDEEGEGEGMDVYDHERVPGGDEYGGALTAAFAARAKAAEAGDEESDDDEGDDEEESG